LTYLLAKVHGATTRAGESGMAISRTALVLLLLPWLVLGCSPSSKLSRANEPTNLIEPEKPAGSHQRVRAPAVAGLFYPAAAPVLAKTINELLADAPPHNIPRSKGLICPHAGYKFSGRTATAAT